MDALSMKLRLRSKSLNNLKCTTEGCDKDAYCKTTCKTCYHRLYAKKRSVTTDDVSKQCCLDGCDKFKYAKGYCTTHYAILKTNSKVGTLGSTGCMIPQCDLTHYGKGYCAPHYRSAIASNQKISSRFSQSRYKANKAKLEWSLTLEQYEDLVTKVCVYCETTLAGATGKALDRLDNAKGYTLDNVVPCCGDCNYLRGIRMSYLETKEVVKLLKQLRKTNCIW